LGLGIVPQLLARIRVRGRIGHRVRVGVIILLKDRRAIDRAEWLMLIDKQHTLGVHVNQC
jgi:hypothetical protein